MYGLIGGHRGCIYSFDDWNLLEKLLFGTLEVNVKIIQSEDVSPQSSYFHLAHNIKWLGLTLLNNSE
jgi:hypothetical protein